MVDEVKRERVPSDGMTGALFCGGRTAYVDGADANAVRTFAAFLAGQAWVCPACMDPDDGCRPGARCCGKCPGKHVALRDGVGYARIMDGGH